MKLQDGRASCGAAAICNALEAMGEHAFQEVVWAMAKGTSDGIDSDQIQESLEALGCASAVLAYKRKADAIAGLRRALAKSAPVIICVSCDSDSDHWVTVVGTLGSRFLIADGADAEIVRSLDTKGLAEWWNSAGGRPHYFGLVVTKRPA